MQLEWYGTRGRRCWKPCSLHVGQFAGLPRHKEMSRDIYDKQRLLIKQKVVQGRIPQQRAERMMRLVRLLYSTAAKHHLNKTHPRKLFGITRLSFMRAAVSNNWSVSKNGFLLKTSTCVLCSWTWSITARRITLERCSRTRSFAGQLRPPTSQEQPS